MKIAVIGCGVMGSALARHFAQKEAVLLVDHNKVSAELLAKEIGAIVEGDIKNAVQKADVILLAIKPKDLSSLAKEIGSLMQEKIVISILAGTSIATLKHHFSQATIVRAMPNLGLVYGQGVIGFVEDRHPTIRQTIASLFAGLGLIIWMSEDKIEALTAISGSGIGFILVMIEAMIDGGVHLGFTVREAREIVLKTMEGAISLMQGSDKHPGELKLQIASPGGTTIAGLTAMEEKGVRAGIVHALTVCYEKALHMRKSGEK